MGTALQKNFNLMGLIQIVIFWFYFIFFFLKTPTVCTFKLTRWYFPRLLMYNKSTKLNNSIKEPRNTLPWYIGMNYQNIDRCYMLIPVQKISDDIYLFLLRHIYFKKHKFAYRCRGSACVIMEIQILDPLQLLSVFRQRGFLIMRICAFVYPHIQCTHCSRN